MVVALLFASQSSLGNVLAIDADDTGIDDCVVMVGFGSSGGLSDLECRDLDDSGGGSKLYVYKDEKNSSEKRGMCRFNHSTYREMSE